MSEYRSNVTVEQAAQRLQSARSILLTSHVKPDGDAIGATLALYRALNDENRPCDIYLMGPLESRLREIAGDTPIHLVEDQPPGDEYDLIVIVDTGAWSQLGPLEGWLRQHREIVISVDHHMKGDDVGAMRLVDSTAASTTQMLVGLLEAMNCELTAGEGGIAEALFVGLATDTGWFRYASADAEVLHLAGRLMELGVDKTRLYRIIEETDRPQRLALQARALASVEYLQEETVAIMTLRPEDFQEVGGSVEDIAELVNTPMSVGTVRAAILLAQTEPPWTKISFRSKPSRRGGDDAAAIDVNELAQQFGGGGHTRAAGARVQMALDEAKAAITAALQ